MNIISTLKHCVPAPVRPPLRKFVYKLFPSLQYSKRVTAELETFSAIEEVHDLPLIAHYWSEKHISPMLAPFGFRNAIEFFRMYVAQACRNKPRETVHAMSIGAGNCATEINIGEWLRENGIENYVFECVDINPALLKRAERAALDKGFADRFVFATLDVNTWKPSGRGATGKYDVIIALQSLHHFVELEILFKKIYQALQPDGYFLSDDMIGRNGHQRWPEALELLKPLWSELPDRYKYNHQLKRMEKEFHDCDCSVGGFEGIRAQDILPLLIRRFHFELFIGFGNIIDPFVDRGFGPNFDPANEWDRCFIDRVHALNQSEIESGRIKPTHMVAAMTKHPVSNIKLHKHLSPEFCVRRT